MKDTATPITGGKFLLRDSGGAFIGTDHGEFTTDHNGQFVITGLTPGVTITAMQTATVSGYLKDDVPQSILIQSGDAQTITFFNALKGALTVRKLDSVTEEPLPGAEFRITTAQGIPVDDNEGMTSTNGVYRTDNDGQIVIRNLSRKPKPRRDTPLTVNHKPSLSMRMTVRRLRSMMRLYKA